MQEFDDYKAATEKLGVTTKEFKAAGAKLIAAVNKHMEDTGKEVADLTAQAPVKSGT